MTVSADYYLMLSGILFAVGALGVLARRNALIIFMSIELMFNAVNLALVSFARQWGEMTGQVLVLFVLVFAAAEVVVGLAIVVTLFRSRHTVDIDDVDQLRG